MKRTFSASITRDGHWYTAQCLDVDVASQGATPDEALRNVGEALALYFEPPHSAVPPVIYSIEVEIGSAETGAMRQST